MISLVYQPKKYTFLVALHALFGLAFYLMPVLAKFYGVLVVIAGLIIVFRSGNKRNEVLLIGGYIVGMEIILRMTGGNLLYEYGKYMVILFMVLGMIYKGISPSAAPFFLYILLLVPGMLIGLNYMNFDISMRKSIAFNMSGPICLGLTALYAYRRAVDLETINAILLSIGLPIISTAVYLFFYAPDIASIITGTASNFEASGGFGPNQVSTILGLGLFIFFSRMMFSSRSTFILVVNLILTSLIAYRGLVTFSRGGMLTGLIMLVALLLFSYLNTNKRGKRKLKILLIFFAISIFSVWTYSSVITDGMINKRYANEDARGREKATQLSGRENIMETDLEFFKSSPIVGIGVAMSPIKRNELTDQMVLSHSEITRLFAEHGSLGVLAFMILFLTPLILYLDNKNHIFLISCFIFWLLTINHAAMRLAAPAFIYGLTLLKIRPQNVAPIEQKCTSEEFTF